MEHELTDPRYSDGASRTRCSLTDIFTDLDDFQSNTPQPFPLQAEPYDTGPLSHESNPWTSFQPFYGLSAEHIDSSYSVSDLPVDANLISWSQCDGPSFQALNRPVNHWPVILGLDSPAFGAPYEDHRQYPVVPTPHQAAYDHAHLSFKPNTQSIDQGSFSAQLYSHGFHGSSPSTYTNLGSPSQYHTLSLSGGPVESLGTRPLAAGTCINIQASHKDEILVDNITANGTNVLTSLVIADPGQSSESSTPNSIGSSPGPDMLDCPACGRFQGDVRRLREHMRCHIKPHICDVGGCGRRFSTSRDLKRHQESAHRKSTLECHICFRKFGGKRADNLQRHLQTKHALEAMYEGPLPFGPL
ncbi:hypothetical protein CH063_04142 [Colletotrichum higginsianum]|uniref:Zinc finger protein 2 n=1 Tax=Colletotrichum higginsianum (strain IMI 349063) TaxID=759273 RepID=H1W4H7_COLHI|nr:Zinc finger protein 2 [Colletotrichum higginsianum IMI 349063]OBR02476.1 Zinc finger protein 2 [Colletotrichum higginsianum IMI 349063]CCF47390.1 hypothetical protein CH063_04142 [Colletotrichum higginsianum]